VPPQLSLPSQLPDSTPLPLIIGAYWGGRAIISAQLSPHRQGTVALRGGEREESGCGGNGDCLCSPYRYGHCMVAEAEIEAVGHGWGMGFNVGVGNGSAQQ